MKFCGLNKTTLLDYPGCVSATIFVGGCNFRCPFCHNGDLVLCSNELPGYTEEEIFAFLKNAIPHTTKPLMINRILANIRISGMEDAFI